MSLRLMWATWSFESRSSARGRVAERECVAHLQSIDEDVDRAATRLIDEVQLLVAVERVVLPVGEIAGRGHEVREAAPVARPRREVDIPALTFDPGRPVRHLCVERQPAHQPDQKPACGRMVDEAQRLGERVAERGPVPVAAPVGHRMAAGRDTAGLRVGRAFRASPRRPTGATENSI